MNAPKMTFSEAVKISWQKEIKTGSPARLARLAFMTLVYTLQLLSIKLYKALCFPLAYYRGLKKLTDYEVRNHHERNTALFWNLDWYLVVKNGNLWRTISFTFGWLFTVAAYNLVVRLPKAVQGGLKNVSR